ADEAEHLPFGDLEADVVHSAHGAIAVTEVFLQASDRQHRRAHSRFPAGICNRRPRESGDPVAFVRKTLDSRDPAPAKAGGGNDDIPKRTLTASPSVCSASAGPREAPLVAASRPSIRAAPARSAARTRSRAAGRAGSRPDRE